MTKEEKLQKLNSLWLCLSTHPDNEPDSEFADRISDLEELIEYEKSENLNEELLEWLKESYKSISFGREPIKISKYGGSFFVKFSDKETYKISLQLFKSQISLD